MRGTLLASTAWRGGSIASRGGDIEALGAPLEAEVQLSWGSGYGSWTCGDTEGGPGCRGEGLHRGRG